MLIPIKNPTLYDQWMSYFEAVYPNMMKAEQRTRAFINSNNNQIPTNLNMIPQ